MAGKLSLRQRIGIKAGNAIARVADSTFTWFGIPLDATSNGNSWQNWQSRSLTTGQVLTVDETSKLSTVWACVRLIAGTISTLPLGVYDENADGSSALVYDHPLRLILTKSPNKDMTSAQFWDAMVRSMLLWGDAWAEIQRIGGRIVALKFLLPSRMTRSMLTDGSLRYLYTDLDGLQREIKEKDLLRIPGISNDGINGLSVIGYGADVFGSARAAGEASGKTFENGLRPGGVLSVDKFLTEKQRDLIRDNILPNFSGANSSGKTLVLEGGMKWAQVSIPPTDAQLLETRQFSVEEICRWFGVPPFMVGYAEKTTSWGSGIEQQMLGFMQYSLRYWYSRIEQACTRRLLTPAEISGRCIEFNLDTLLRADSAGRATFNDQMVNKGIYTLNEIRRKERLSDVEGGDKIRVPSNLTTLDKLGETPPAPNGGLGSQPGDPKTPQDDNA